MEHGVNGVNANGLTTESIEVAASHSADPQVLDGDTKRKMDRRRNPVKTREQLINSGTILFNDPGYFFTDSNQIAKHAGFAPGTFYQHFKNKNELFAEIHDIWSNKIRDIVKLGLENQKTPEAFAQYFVKNLIPHFENWAGLRASWRALTATDKQFHERRLLKVKEFVEVCDVVRQSFGKAPMTKIESMSLLMMIERYSDALSDGEFSHLGVSKEDVEKLMIEMTAASLSK